MINSEQHEFNMLADREELLNHATGIHQDLRDKAWPLYERANFDEQQIFSNLKTIPFDHWCWIALYGPHGYYGSGRARINVPNNDYATMVGSLSDVEGVLRHTLSQLHPEPGQPIKLLSLNHGNGDFEQNLERLRVMYPDTFRTVQLQSIDISAGMLAKGTTSNRTQADAGNLPFGSNTFDVVFSNELYDALPVLRYVKRGGSWFSPHVGYDFIEQKRFFFYVPCTPAEEKLVNLGLRYDTDQGLATSAMETMILPIGAVSIQRESSRVLRPGGLVVSCDYTARHPNGTYNNMVYTFPERQELPKNIGQYSGGDISSKMDPDFVLWAGQAFGLALQELTSIEEILLNSKPRSLGTAVSRTMTGDQSTNPRLTAHKIEVLLQTK